MQVRAALERKIVRERIGSEIAGCFDGPQPLQAAAYLLQLKAFSVVFQVSTVLLVFIHTPGDVFPRCLVNDNPNVIPHSCFVAGTQHRQYSTDSSSKATIMAYLRLCLCVLCVRLLAAWSQCE